MDPDLEYTNISQPIEKFCLYSTLQTFTQLIDLFRNSGCFKHSLAYTVLLCVCNIFIFIFGVAGNILVIYVVSCKVSRKTASCIFILNLAVADLLVIFVCVPPTLLANIFPAWILGAAMCKAVTYSQGAFVFISVYSVVALSFDRFRAVYWPFGRTRSLTLNESLKIIGVIWTAGLLIPLPWIFVFELIFVRIGEHHDEVPFCHEAWSSGNQEIAYFLAINMFLCYVLPLAIIAICNIYIWKNLFPSGSNGTPPLHRRTYFLKVFTFLTFLFFLLWLPLYIVMTRVKLFYTREFQGGPLENSVMFVLIPIVQLLGSCNSCVNPILYAVFNRSYRETLLNLLCINACMKQRSETASIECNERQQGQFCMRVTMQARCAERNTSL